MRYSIQIPEPCHESWEEMTPTDKGRHCALCCKDVVDFTGWQPDDIVNYLKEHSANHICGRFTEDQVSVPVSDEEFVQTIVRVRMPYFRKIAAIFLFAFGLLQLPAPQAHAQERTGMARAMPRLIADTTHGPSTDSLDCKPQQTDTEKPRKPVKPIQGKMILRTPVPATKKK